MVDFFCENSVAKIGRMCGLEKTRITLTLKLTKSQTCSPAWTRTRDLDVTRISIFRQRVDYLIIHMLWSGAF
jgi:hypothetical protein